MPSRSHFPECAALSRGGCGKTQGFFQPSHLQCKLGTVSRVSGSRFPIGRARWGLDVQGGRGDGKRKGSVKLGAWGLHQASSPLLVSTRGTWATSLCWVLPSTRSAQRARLGALSPEQADQVLGKAVTSHSETGRGGQGQSGLEFQAAT